MLTACAFNEASGERVGGASAKAMFQSVDIVFMDAPALSQGGLGALVGAPTNYGLMSKAGTDVRTAMRELRDGADAALIASGVPGRAVLLSERMPRGVAATVLTHVVMVSMKSATAGTQTGTSIVLNVEVAEFASRQSLWKGTARAYPGGAGFGVQAMEKDRIEKGKIFGESLIKAMRDAGVLLSTKH
ncbi:hypothetical protein [Roseateles sp.]|uniref:hypothetical protein n=2 Tax=Roseateles sp. TaxID=1971397 RepID=UPI003267D29F